MREKERTSIRDDEAIDTEIEELKKSTDKVNKVLDRILRLKQGNINRLINIGFVVSLIALFFARFILHWIDNMLSLELGVILISIKIIWLIRIQSEYNHYIFIIMDSINKRQKEILEGIDAIKGAKGR